MQALTGTEGSKTIILRGHLEGKEVFMLVDSGSSHSFINDQLALQFKPWQKLKNPVQVQVANGERLACTHELPDQLLRFYLLVAMTSYWVWTGWAFIVPCIHIGYKGG